MVMERHYDQSYYFAEKFGPKRYAKPDGSVGEFGYTQGGLWNFQGILDELCYLLGKPESVLDLGSGCGGFVATCVKNGIEALGLEFSRYAIDNAIMGAKPLLKKWDLADIPWPIDKPYDWVTAIDLYEHLFLEDVDRIVAETKRAARHFIIAKICTAQRPHEVWSAKKASYEEVYAQAKREGYEWLVVSGHVNSQWPKFWRDRFQDRDWRLRDDLAERLKVRLNLPEDWRCTLILKNYSYEL
jgi:SAM-dependent methyltransferase